MIKWKLEFRFCIYILMTTALLICGLPQLIAQETEDQAPPETEASSEAAPETAPETAPEPAAEEVGELPLAPTPRPEEEKRFTYNHHGMRDPFVSLVEKESVDLGSGIGSMKIQELTLQGILEGLGKIAIVLGSDDKVYPMRVGDSVLDGKLVSIGTNRIVFEKIIFDAFGREKEKRSIEIHLHRR